MAVLDAESGIVYRALSYDKIALDGGFWNGRSTT